MMEDKDFNFEEFMRESLGELKGKNLIFTPNIKPGFKSGSFDAGSHVVVGAVSETYRILVLDRRNRSPLIPQSALDLATTLVVDVPKGQPVLVPIQRSYPGEPIGHGLVEFAPKEIMFVLIGSGLISQQLDNAFKRKN